MPASSPRRVDRSSPAPSPSKLQQQSCGTAESTFHRRLRSLVAEHTAAKRAWNSIVIDRGLAVASSVVALHSEIECAPRDLVSPLSLLERHHRSSKSYMPRDLRLSEEQKIHLRECYVAKKKAELDRRACDLANLLLELVCLLPIDLLATTLRRRAVLSPSTAASDLQSRPRPRHRSESDARYRIYLFNTRLDHLVLLLLRCARLSYTSS